MRRPISRRCPSRRSRRSADLFDHRHRRRRHRHRDHRRRARHGGASRRQGHRHHRSGRARAEGRRGLQPHPHRRSPKTSTPSASPQANATSCSAATWWWSATRRCCPRKLGGTTMVINTAEILPGDFTRNADFAADRAAEARDQDRGRRREDAFRRCDAACDRAARQLDRRQHLHGRLRLSAGRAAASRKSIEKAIELNGEAVAMNLAAFQFGRRAAHDLAAVEALVKPAPGSASDARRLSQSFDETVARRVKFLTDYQDAVARRYRALVDQVKAPRPRAPGKTGLADGALSVQADGLQGRVRGRAALRRAVIPRSGEERGRGR